MGSIQSKDMNNPWEEDVKGMREKVRVLQKEKSEIMCMRENESQAYEQEMVVCAFKEGEWKRERKRLREEVKKLRKKLEEREERIKRGILENNHEKTEEEGDLQLFGSATGASYLVEQINEERRWRDGAAERWKQLYLAIKIELDDLLQRAHQGETFSKEKEEDLVEQLKRELKAKDETIEVLKARIALLEQEESKRGREVDILRQSLKILSHKKKPKHNGIVKSLSRSFRLQSIDK